jgi:hypothetical protein
MRPLGPDDATPLLNPTREKGPVTWSGVAVPHCGPGGHDDDARSTIDIRKPEFTNGYLFDVVAVLDGVVVRDDSASRRHKPGPR